MSRDGVIMRPVKIRVAGRDFDIPAPAVFNPGLFEPFAHPGTYAADRVRAPEFLVEPNPRTKIDILARSYHDMPDEPHERAEVLFREGVRHCIEAGVSHEAMVEMLNLEITKHVMNS